jgi:Icc-related predicted phosphoesterase
VTCFFASDLHGCPGRWTALCERIASERPAAVFLGGDLGPSVWATDDLGGDQGFLRGWLAPRLRDLRQRLRDDYPRMPTILGNDDPAVLVADLEALESEGLLEHAHLRRLDVAGVMVLGCAWVPPTPFVLKDWERYDVGRGVDPGAVSPEEGRRSVPVDAHVVRWATIAADLEDLRAGRDIAGAVLLLHAPPYQTNLDRAALDGQQIDGVPFDVHVGSIAVRRFLEQHGPAVALCGHVHEAARLTGAWTDRVGETVVLGAAHDGPELALVRFDPHRPGAATRELIAPVAGP